MTPVGHAAVGYVTGRVARRLPSWPLVVGAILPDVDYLLVWAPQFNAWHRVVTHNVWFVALAAAVGAWLVRSRRDERGMVAMALLFGGLTHLITDSVLDTNATNGIGVAWLWPVLDAVWSPFDLLEVRDNPAGWGDPLEAAKGVLGGLAWELPLWFVALVLGFCARRARTSARSG